MVKPRFDMATQTPTDTIASRPVPPTPEAAQTRSQAPWPPQRNRSGVGDLQEICRLAKDRLEKVTTELKETRNLRRKTKDELE